MTVQRFRKLSDIPGIEEFIEGIPFFATQNYANYLEETEKYCINWFYAYINPDIKLIIPFTIRKKYFFRIGTFLTATIQLNKIISVETEREYLNSVIKFIKSEKLCDWIEQPPNWAIFSSYPDGAVYAPFGTYKINLHEKSLDELFNSIQKDDQRDIKKAIRENVLIKTGFDYLPDALVLINKTATAAGMPLVHDSEILGLKSHLGDDLWVYVAYDKMNSPQSSVIFFSNNFSTYGIYGGSITKPARGCGTYLHWEAIKNSKLKNVKYYDFVGARINPEPGSKQERIQRFKEHFGVELFKGYLWKMPISRFKYSLYSYLLKTVLLLKQKKFKGDIIDQERKKNN